MTSDMQTLISNKKKKKKNILQLSVFTTQSNLIYGWKTPAYRTFGNALITIISLQIGIFDYDEVQKISLWRWISLEHLLAAADV